MRILVCQHRREHASEATEELITAFLQEGHEVHAGRPNRAGRRFDPELVIARYLPGHLACVWFARRRRVPLCLFIDTRPRRPPPLWERMIWRTDERVVAADAELKDEVAALGVPPERIDIFPGGFLPERFLPAPFTPRRNSDAVVLGWIGGNSPKSIAAPDLALVVIGDAVPRARVADILTGIDIALFPEPSAPRLIYCMAAGRAIVAPDTPAMRELVEHERTALLFTPSEDGAMLRAAARLIADPGLRARLGEAARAELTRRDLTWRALARRLASAMVGTALQESVCLASSSASF
jgi:glycosyltransferase involved in cell wall biosynthesis